MKPITKRDVEYEIKRTAHAFRDKMGTAELNPLTKHALEKDSSEREGMLLLAILGAHYVNTDGRQILHPENGELLLRKPVIDIIQKEYTFCPINSPRLGFLAACEKAVRDSNLTDFETRKKSIQRLVGEITDIFMKNPEQMICYGTGGDIIYLSDKIEGRIGLIRKLYEPYAEYSDFIDYIYQGFLVRPDKESRSALLKKARAL